MLRLFVRLFDRRVVALCCFVSLTATCAWLLPAEPRFRFDDRILHHQFVSFSSDGSGVFLVGRPPDDPTSSPKIQCWDARTGNLRFTADRPIAEGSLLALAPDGQRLVVADGPVVAQIDAKDGRTISEWQLPQVVTGLIVGAGVTAVSRNGDRAALYNVLEKRLIGEVGPIGGTHHLMVSRDGRRGAALSDVVDDAARIRVWDLTSAELLFEDKAMWGRASWVGFADDGCSAAQVFWRNPKVVFLWWKLPHYNSGPAAAVAGDTDNRRLADYVRLVNDTTMLVGGTTLYDVSTNPPTAVPLPISTGRRNLSPSARFYVESPNWLPGPVDVYDAQTDALLWSLANQTELFRWASFEWSPDDQLLIAISQSATSVPGWIDSLLRKIGLPLPRLPSVERFSVFDAASGRRLADIPKESNAQCIPSPDGRSIYANGALYSLPLWRPWWKVLALPTLVGLLIWGPWRRPAGERGGKMTAGPAPG